MRSAPGFAPAEFFALPHGVIIPLLGFVVFRDDYEIIAHTQLSPGWPGEQERLMVPYRWSGVCPTGLVAPRLPGESAHTGGFHQMSHRYAVIRCQAGYRSGYPAH